MVELQTISRITVYADAALEQSLLERFLEMGATGYSSIDCRGKGKHEIIADPFSGHARVRIELLVQTSTAEQIMAYLSRPEFKRRAIAACVETVQVPMTESY
jgi:hypothetical protein